MQEEGRRRPPLIAIFKVELSCPARCEACSSRKQTFTRMRPRVMPLPYFASCIRELAELGTQQISLSGGEPTLLPNLSDYIAICHDHGIATQLNTNGWGLTEGRLRTWLDHGLKTVILSCYSLDARSFRRLRGVVSLLPRMHTALSAVAHLRRERHFNAILQTIVTPVNMRELPQLLTRAMENGFDLFWPSYLEDSVNLPDLRMKQADITDFRQHVVPDLHQVAGRLPDGPLCAAADRQIDLLFNHPGVELDKLADGDYGHIPRTCPLVENFALVYPDGAIAPCAGHEYQWSPSVRYNDGQSLVAILTGTSFEEFRLRRSEYCRYCPHGLHVGLTLRPGASE
ncbi:MAG: radical SAM/SPASM domain-containing protein [Thermoanaerobaculaceae bacterium]